MKRLALIALVCAVFAVGCGSTGNANNSGGAYEDGQPVQAPTTTESDLINESNEIANDPNMSAQDKQQAICDEMKAQGSFDGTGVNPAEVGC